MHPENVIINNLKFNVDYGDNTPCLGVVSSVFVYAGLLLFTPLLYTCSDLRRDSHTLPYRKHQGFFFFSCLKRAGHCVDHPSQSRAEVRNEESSLYL